MNRQRAEINRRPSSFMFFFQWARSPTCSLKASPLLLSIVLFSPVQALPCAPSFPVLSLSGRLLIPSGSWGPRLLKLLYGSEPPEIGGPVHFEIPTRASRSRFVLIDVRVCVHTNSGPLSFSLFLSEASNGAISPRKRRRVWERRATK